MYHYFERYNTSLKYEATKNEIELNKLKSQLNPHFIFNALNSIRALVDENPRKAKNAITQLSSILRSSLVMNKSKLTHFDEEMNAVKDYLELESIRFEERLRTEFDLHPQSNQFLVPPLMIQTLVENGIKHGISNLKEGGTISLRTAVNGSSLIIQIRNDGQLINGRPRNPRGFGIDNTKQRLQLIFGGKASFRIFNDSDKTVLTELIIPKNI
jgi:LytS/YehU family sensor histidine kinase